PATHLDFPRERKRNLIPGMPMVIPSGLTRTNRSAPTSPSATARGSAGTCGSSVCTRSWRRRGTTSSPRWCHQKLTQLEGMSELTNTLEVFEGDMQLYV
uniref:Uncharacterized protein n=1 Tax=Serinus canaria TaxID=9135 RepID=A0A8C9NF27_SERCA